jgi:hypothetical protein
MKFELLAFPYAEGAGEKRFEPWNLPPTHSFSVHIGSPFICPGMRANWPSQGRHSIGQDIFSVSGRQALAVVQRYVQFEIPGGLQSR